MGLIILRQMKVVRLPKTSEALCGIPRSLERMLHIPMIKLR